MKLQKRGQGISINIIIVAAIALLVLVVLVAIFSGRMGIFNRDLDQTTKGTCVQKGGQVVTGACPNHCEQLYGRFDDVGTQQVCCKPSMVCTGATGCDAYGSENTCENAGCSWQLTTRPC